MTQLDALTRAELVDRFEQVDQLARTAAHADLPRAIDLLDEICLEAEHRQDWDIFLRAARGAVHARLDGETDLHTARARCELWTGRATEAGRGEIEADGHATLGILFSRLGRPDDALDEAVTATMLLDDPATVARWEDTDPRLMSYAYNDLHVCLAFLGLYPPADAMIDRAVAVHRRADARTGGAFSRSDDRRQYVAVGCNRIRTNLLWGLSEESSGTAEVAHQRFGVARDVAVELVAGIGTGQHAEVDCCHLTARALYDPQAVDPAEFTVIDRANGSKADLVRADIAAARCLEARNRDQEARSAMRHAVELVTTEAPAHQLRLMTLREEAKLAALLDTGGQGSPAYVLELEQAGRAASQDRLAVYLARSIADRLRRRSGAGRRQALDDPLTGLPDRREMDSWPDRLTTGSGPGSTVGLIDIDGLTPINEERSPAVGDAVICAVADVLHASLRPADSIARYGGDQFVVLLAGRSALEARDALRRAVDAVATLPASLGCGVTVSGGLAPVLAPSGLAAAVALADAARHDAKHAGGNRIRIRGVPRLDPAPATDVPQPTEPELDRSRSASTGR